MNRESPPPFAEGRNAHFFTPCEKFPTPTLAIFDFSFYLYTRTKISANENRTPIIAPLNSRELTKRETAHKIALRQRAAIRNS